MSLDEANTFQIRPIGFFSSNSNHFTSQVIFLIHTRKEELSEGTVDWLFMLCAYLNVV